MVIREKSAGAVVFYKKEGEPEYLLLLYGQGHWDFPKGNVEQGEHELDTVKREVYEETGIDDIIIIEGFRNIIRYYYRLGGQLVRKEVAFYLAETWRKHVKLSYEHKGYVWLGYGEALKKLTFKTAKETLVKAHNFLIQKGIVNK